MANTKQQAARDHLHELATFLRGWPPGLSTVTAQTLADAIDEHLSAGVPLDVALRLRRGRGERSIRTTIAFAERDRIICKIARKSFAGLSTEGQANAIAVRWQRYASTAWLRERALPDCPARRLGTVEGELFKLQSLVPRPLRARRLVDILAREPLFDANP